ncbi:hypothetical protein A2955_05350 [Candidatus Woesebacteria bacterium RIFCSPLOWO2_01_FULL_37_19]|uniref:Peptidase M20 dimerisation domain-containing protein n=2 Tax=Candidatus Woeseibacteriota TaxID=1752722 RepID=A0A1F8B5R4_9BACT|nr:MAG: hypothetical protein A2771_04495 [Candidatus Woesebacteria bacterium RIFCSPHIGHO2_01_FULL_38_26b]OGM59250.1 MAG: hypothetical protein A2955_05350 [Candidatus Woesebacteria bacterium RIFCSPLOWO2_01_FULL_37_19]
MDLQKYLDGLFEFLTIPSISAQSEHKKDINSATVWLQKKFSDLDFNANILPTNGHPVVYAENLRAGKEKPTILVYGHYDVQDPGNLNEWITKPFIPEIRSGNLYARGSSDDKGQLYTWIAAIEELIKRNDIDLNIKFLIEGEEELGSLNLDEFIEQNKSLLVSDFCVISDSHCLSENQPMIDYGLRGIVYVEIKVKTLGKDSHSGIYGGNILNPLNVLAEIVSKLKGHDFKVLIPKFYESVRKISIQEKRRLSRLPLTEKDIISETGAQIVIGEPGYTLHERAGARPTLDVNGIWGGYQGEGPKTIIPSEANAKISMRLVPFQTSADIYQKFVNYVQKITPPGVELTIKLLSTAEPILFNIKSKYFKVAEKSYENIFGSRPVYELSGGTIGVTASFKNILGINSILMGYGLPDDGLHGPNEKLSLSMFEKGIKTNIEFLKNI